MEVLYQYNTERVGCSLAPCVTCDCFSGLHTGAARQSVPAAAPTAKPGPLLHQLLLCRLQVTLILWPLLHFARLVWQFCRPLAELSLSAIASDKLPPYHMSERSRRCRLATRMTAKSALCQSWWVASVWWGAWAAGANSFPTVWRDLGTRQPVSTALQTGQAGRAEDHIDLLGRTCQL